jgi:superfamily II DNA or RNA helicase
VKVRKLDEILRTETHDPSIQADWDRQLQTAEAIDERFSKGFRTVLLADEVGMGKTYVALAAMAQHVFQTDANDRRVMLVVPPNSILRTKWEQEIRSFNKNYLCSFALEADGEAGGVSGSNCVRC